LLPLDRSVAVALRAQIKFRTNNAERRCIVGGCILVTEVILVLEIVSQRIMSIGVEAGGYRN